MSVQWEYCAARNAVIRDASSSGDDDALDAAMLALGAASLEDSASAAAFSSEPCSRVVL